MQPELVVASYRQLDDNFKKPRLTTGLHLLIIFLVISAIVLAIVLPVVLRTPPPEVFRTQTRYIAQREIAEDTTFGGFNSHAQHIDNLLHLRHFRVFEPAQSTHIEIDFLNRSNTNISRIYFAFFASAGQGLQARSVFCAFYPNMHKMFRIDQTLAPGQNFGTITVRDIWRNVTVERAGIRYVRVVLANGNQVAFCLYMINALFATRLRYA